MTAIEIPTPDPRTFDDSSRPFAEAISPHYAIKKLIGRGGMGIVYLARDRRLDRLVAIKTLLPHLAGDSAVRERFLRETRMAGAMSHPNIVPIHGADEIDGHVFFVMGFVDGDSLATHVRAHGRLEPVTAVSYLRDVASALAHAHRRGTIHRDIKPENILVERATGRAVVTDFGIARLAEAQPITATGQLLGTVYYVSPEQVAGETIDARSDLYSLGVVGFFALTGQFPFDGEIASAVLVSHVTKAAAPVRSINAAIPPGLAAVIDRCLAKRPADRFASADEVLAALGAPLEAAATDKNSHLVSETRAQAIWARAAELQASTKAHDKLPLDVLKSVANEAGIAERYVDRALAEQTPPPRRSLLVGIPLDVTAEIVVEGEVSTRDFDRVMNALRDATGQMGVTTAKSREIAWRGSSLTRRIEISVVPDRGTTTIRVTQSMRRVSLEALVVALQAGWAAGAGAAIGLHELMDLPAFDWRFRLDHDLIEMISIYAGIGVGLTTIPGWRWLMKRLRSRAVDRVQKIADAVAAKVRESIG